MIAFRRAHPVLSKEQFYADGDVRWLGRTGESPNWSETASKSFACLIREEEECAILLMFNAGEKEAGFVVPPPPQASHWHVAVDTSRSPPHDFFSSGQEPLLDSSKPYRLEARSSAILLLKNSSRAL
jgi:glycogen operon protein